MLIKWCDVGTSNDYGTCSKKWTAKDTGFSPSKPGSVTNCYALERRQRLLFGYQISVVY